MPNVQHSPDISNPRNGLLREDSDDIKNLKEQIFAMQQSLGTIERRNRKILQYKADETNNNSTGTNVTLNSPQSRSTHIQSSIINNGAHTHDINQKSNPRVCKPDVYNGETNENASLWLNAMK